MDKQVFTFCLTHEKIIEKIVTDERVHINHVVLGQGEALPVHNANAFVYQIITRGTMKQTLGDNKPELHPAGTILAIPQGSKMSIENGGVDVLEFFIIKAPAPQA